MPHAPPARRPRAPFEGVVVEVVRAVHPAPRRELRLRPLRRLLQLRRLVLRRQQRPGAPAAPPQLLVRLLQRVERAVLEAPELEAPAHDHGPAVPRPHAVVRHEHSHLPNFRPGGERLCEAVLPQQLQVVVKDEHLRVCRMLGAGRAAPVRIRRDASFGAGRRWFERAGGGEPSG